MATINEWNVEKLEEYSSLYPWVGTEIFLWLGPFIFFLFFALLFSGSIEKIMISRPSADLIAFPKTSFAR